VKTAGHVAAERIGKRNQVSAGCAENRARCQRHQVIAGLRVSVEPQLLLELAAGSSRDTVAPANSIGASVIMPSTIGRLMVSLLSLGHMLNTQRRTRQPTMRSLHDGESMFLKLLCDGWYLTPGRRQLVHS
jgi:hypothetical protein